ncbi:colanic acid biosynthesis glycosyltransferase WcaL [bacterium]|nr:MAG: colanic acid biosynthesis glycosyltransferase WcaL [bacterium]
MTLPTATPRVAYLMSRFPKLTETFVLYEMLAVESAGVAVDVYPLLRARDTGVHTEGATVRTKLAERFKPARADAVMHAEAADLVRRARYQPLMSPAILASQLYWLVRRPAAYAAALGTLVRANLGSRRLLGGALAFFPQAAHNARRMRADGVTHVHAHFATHPAAMAWAIHRLTGIPYSFTAHGSDLHVDRHMLVEKVAEAAFVATVSEYNRRLIADTCGPRLGAAVRDKVHVVRCGVDTAVFSPPAAAGETVDRPPFTVLCIGTLYEVKGHTYLVEACRRLVERGIDVRAWLVGEGLYRDRLAAQIAAAGLSGRVHLLGRRTRAEIADLLRQADALAVPSVPTADGRREGIPVVLMEAMASGVAVVASDLSGIPELVVDGETGLLAPPRDAGALADALARLAGDAAFRRRLARAGRERVLTEYDVGRNAARLAARFAAAGGAT